MEEKTTKAEIIYGLKAIMRHVKPFKIQLLILVALGLVSAVANGFVPYITGRFFDALIGVSHGEVAIFAGLFPLWASLLFAWTIVQLVANNIDWIMDRLRRRVDNEVQFNIQTSGFKHLLGLPIAYHKDTHIDGALQKLGQASWRVSSIVRTIIEIAPQFLSIIIGIVLAASINTTIAGILLAGVILYVILLIKILIPIATIDSLAHKTWNDGWSDAAASVQQIESVKQATSEKYESDKVHKKLNVEAFGLWSNLERIWSNVSFFQRTIVFFTQLCVFLLSVRFISAGIITVGELISLNGYALMFFGPFVSLGYSWQTIQNGIISAAHAESIFQPDEEKYIPDDVIPLKQIKGEIIFNNVYFRYGKDGPAVLSNVNINVKQGDIVALVGESGVGKSTVISLISGYYFPTKGEVLVDGVDTRKINLNFLRKHIGVVPQEVALFNDSLKVNIKYGSFGVSDGDVMKASKEAQIDKFISKLSDGYNTIVGERGIKLSVGQKQRVSIARAILRSPSILILDEPTSALDAKTERFITKSLEKLMKGRTTFIIAHRLSTVRKANKIFVFDKGKIVEFGSHEELLKKENGVYKNLYEYQVGLH